MKKITYFALMLMIASLVFSCKKKKDPEPTPAQKILGKWKYLSATISDGSTTISFPSCNLDDIFEFKTGDILVIDEGATKCDPSDPQTTTGSYILNAAGTILTIIDPSQGSDATAFEVLELTNTKLRLKANLNSFIIELSMQKI